MPPRLIRNLLAEVEGSNGKARMSSRPYVVRGESPGEVDELIEVIRDDSRMVPVVVGGAFDSSVQEGWIEVVDKLTRSGVGLLSAVVLDAAAVGMFNDRVGDAYQVQPGGVRTYHCKIRAGDASDALRHRFIVPATMSRIVSRDSRGRLRVSNSIASALAWNARRAVLDAGLPRGVRRVDTILRRATAEDRVKTAPQRPIIERLMTSDVHGPDTGYGPGEPTQEVRPVTEARATASLEVTSAHVNELAGRLLVAVGSVFGADDVTGEHVDGFVRLVSALAQDFPVLEAENAAYEALLDDVARDSETLREKLARTEARISEVELDAAIAEEERRRVEREAAWLRRQAIAAQQYEVLAGSTDPEPPKDLSGLLDLLESAGGNRPVGINRIHFTGDRSMTEQLLKYDNLGRIAGAAWDVVLVLNDYAESKADGETRNLHDYLTTTPPGRRPMARHRFRSAESQTVATNKRWRAERTFPVPETVDPTGEVFMFAHFELGRGDMVSPRLHFHDAVELDGRIYIGYVGRHLTNTMS